MLKLEKIAVTGSVSSGKSEVAKYFKKLGAHVVDADKIVHQLLTPDTELGTQVINLLGEGILADGVIDRTRVAKKVFLNPKLLRPLEEILHPAVYEEIERQYQKAAKKEKPPQLFIAEVPLLFESKGEQYFDKTIAVLADQEQCWERYRRSTGHEREDFSRRVARQMKQEEKAKLADYTIRNDGSLKTLHAEVAAVFETLSGGKAKEQ